MIGSAMPVEIREGTAGEEEQLVEMYERLFAAPGSRRWQWWTRTGRATGSAKRSPRYLLSAILVAEDGGALIAFCTAYLDLDSVRFGQR